MYLKPVDEYQQYISVDRNIDVTEEKVLSLVISRHCKDGGKI
jgi:hypothetical protein